MKYILGVVLVLVVVTLVFILRPPPVQKAGTIEVAPAQITSTDEDAPAREQQTGAEQRRAAMQAEYEKLAQARRNLESKLNNVKVVLWDLKLPKDESDLITETMKNGYAQLKNPRMLGAYSGMEELSAELAQVQYLYTQLQAIEDKYRGRDTRP